VAFAADEDRFRRSPRRSRRNAQGSRAVHRVRADDEAFAKLPAGALDKLLADKEKLKAVLLFHEVAGKVTAKDVMASNGVIHVIDTVLMPK